MGDPEVKYVDYNGSRSTSSGLLNQIKLSILYREQLAVNDVIAALGGNNSSNISCTIRYHTGNGVLKDRTLQPGQTFKFGYDIHSIELGGKKVTDVLAFQTLFSYADNVGKFTVHSNLFGNVVTSNSGEQLKIDHTRPDDTWVHHVISMGSEFYFDQHYGRYQVAPSGDPIEPKPPKRPTKPDPPPIPAPPKGCLCPCPVCRLDHLTDEQRKQRDERQKKDEQERRNQLQDLRVSIDRTHERQRKEEQERQDQLQVLRESINRTHELARNAASISEHTRQSLRDIQSDVQNIYRELADIRAVLGNIPTRRRWDISPWFKVCMVSSQILALVVLGDYTWRTIIQGRGL